MTFVVDFGFNFFYAAPMLGTNFWSYTVHIMLHGSKFIATMV